MKMQMAGIALLLFGILLSMKSNGLDVFILCVGMIGLSMAIVGAFIESNK